ncbi:MAG: SGNH/GDSL hydrolase family protein [Sphingobacteriaceae bacterium]|nr:MAG: SGNH/GDSL hydrolase family protein [Sphingobacteriaceae bacterium]
MKRLVILLCIVSIFIACKKQNNTSKEVMLKHPFGNVVILGNSITYAPANPSSGWNCNCGMAASALEKDYVHLLATKFKQQNINANVVAKNIAEFEINYLTYNFDTELKTYHDSKPDLLILRIGENVQSTFDSVEFAKRYQGLIAYMKTDNPQLKVLAVGSIWYLPNKDYINNIMSRYTPYISLAALGTDNSNFAFDMKNVSDGVKQHPGDKGMQAIADVIWKKVLTMTD